jgi:hypothetical protein
MTAHPMEANICYLAIEFKNYFSILAALQEQEEHLV